MRLENLTMGGAASKRKFPSSSAFEMDKFEDVRKEEELNTSNYVVDSVDARDSHIMNSIRLDLYERPEMFVLNNVLMCIMYFESYSKVIREAIDSRYTNSQKCISPDLILEKVNKNVRYRPLHGPESIKSQSLAPKRLYITNDKIHILDILDEQQDFSTETLYQLKMEESKRKGFVRLRNKSPVKFLSGDESPFTLTDSSSVSRNSSDTSSSGTSYDYTALTELKTPRPIEIANSLKNIQDPVKSCFEYRKVRRAFCDIDMDKDISEFSENDIFDTVSYFTSNKYMKRFEKDILPSIHPETLGFNLFDSQNSLCHGKIICNTSIGDQINVQRELIPCLTIAWPRNQTIQFVMGDSTPNGRATWPSNRTIKELQRLECTLVPKGYTKKDSDQFQSGLEWEIQFPQAEKYMDSCMSHAQMRCYLTLLTLYKTYIQETNEVGLQIEHLKTHMFWEIENSYTHWPEHRLGIKMMKVLKNLQEKLKKRNMPDFFIRDKNVLESIPRTYLTRAGKNIHDIIQSPLMSFMKALRNLRYTSGKFYPPLDFKELHAILLKKTECGLKPDVENIPPPRTLLYTDAETQRKYLRQVERKQKERYQRKKTENQSNLIVKEERRGSVDSIDLDWKCDKQFDINKRKELLLFFINNFIAIAKTSSKIGSNSQTMFYLKQAWYLTKILQSDSLAFNDEAILLLEKIEKVENECKFTYCKEISVGKNKFASPRKIVALIEDR